MKVNPNNCWDKALELIKQNVTPQQYETWFKPLVLENFDENTKTILVQVPSPFVYEYLEENFLGLLRTVLCRTFCDGAQLAYRVVTDKENKLTQDIEADPADAEPKKACSRGNQPPSSLDVAMPQEIDSQLNPHLTFKNYVEGSSNKLPRSVGMSIAEHPSTPQFNPMFIFGPSGCGKTHLINAIGVHCKQMYPEKRVLYISARLFQVQYTNAVLQNTINDFINFYQTIDMLIVDDIQEWATATKTQDTFFHIFNHLHQNNKQLVMTSDCPPMDMQGMEERLLTRFRWGLTTRLERPDKELRKKILQNKVLSDGLSIPSNVIDFIAENVTENVRDLEGIVVSLMAHSIINNREIDMNLARRVVEQSIKFERKRITVQKIQDTVSEFFDIKKELIQSSSRKREIVQARQVTMFFIKKHTELSLSQIGVQVGNRNHATVLHACNTVKNFYEVDKAFRSDIEEIEKLLNA